MKKMLLFFLLIAGTGNVLQAQIELPDPVENTFNNPKTARGNASFTFFLAGHTRVVLDLTYVSQAAHLPDLDSLLKVARTMLAPLRDSLRNDGVVRRVDMVMRNEIPKIRIVPHPELSTTYTVKDNELMQLKVSQDTIRLIGFATSNVSGGVVNNGVFTRQLLGAPFSVSIIADNVADLEKVGEGELNECITLLRSSIDRHIKWDRVNANAINYRASFILQSKKMVWPYRMSYVFVGEPKTTLHAGFSMSYAKGSVLPGLTLGFDYNMGQFSGYRSKLRLYLENQAYFSRDPVTNKVNTEWNRFVGIQYLEGKPTDKFAIMGNLNLSYLLNSKSSLYDPHTFRLSMPVVATKLFTIEPQITFTGFFKNVSPAIRFVINF